MIPTLALVLTLAQPAPAAPDAPASPTAAKASAKDKASARALLREGTRLYSKGKHQDALDRFTRAYQLYASPKLLYNIALAQRELGHDVEALTAFESFLTEVHKPPPRLAAEVRRSIAELQAKLSELQILVNVAGADLTVDDRPLGRTPLAHSVWVSPGAHEIAARKDGFLPATKAIEARPGAVEQVAITLPPLVPVARVATTRPAAAATTTPIYRRPWFWIAAGALVAGTAAVVALR